MKRKIYLASSWRNQYQPSVLEALRDAGHETYDFRNPGPGEHGFQWDEVDPNWLAWDPETFRDALAHPISQHGFTNDYGAMQWADTGVLLLPSGRSAHFEAGYFNGAGKPLYILLLELPEPELMYLMAGHERICLSVKELLDKLAEDATPFRPDWVVAPGETIKDLLDEQNLTPRLFAKMVGLSEADATALLAGELPLTDELSERLGTVFGIPVTFWRNLERTYRAGPRPVAAS
jgi:plasmid maintenance system antidote protein VapI